MVDPEHNQPGLSKNNQLQETVWKEFIDSPLLLHRTTEAIQAAIAPEALEESAVPTDEEDVFPEGHILTRQHLHRERNRAAVVAKIDQVWRRDGRLACEACGFDFLDFYGELGRGLAECHQVVPLAEAVFSRKTRLADLAIVCANCHRMLHRSRPVLTVDNLKSLIARPYRPQYGGSA